MKIYLNATSVNENLWPLIENEPVALIKLAGKFLIEYLLESCTRSEIKSIIIIGGRHCDTLKDKLGTGTKWGIELTYKDNITNSKDLAIINVDSLYNMDLHDLIEMSKNNKQELLHDYFIQNNYNDATNDHNEMYLKSGCGSDYSTNEILKIHNYSSYYDACMKLVSSQLSECMIDPHQFGYKVIEGSRVVYNQENFTNGYTFIGDRTRISPTSKLSSNVVIGADVVIDDYAQLNHSIIMDNTYIGKMLKVDNSIVKGNYLLSIKYDSCTKIKDKILIDNLRLKTRNKGFMKRVIEMTLPAA